MEIFEGKVALVTGGSSGIGRSTAVLFCKRGAKVVVANRRIKEGEETVKMIKDSGGEGFFVKTDVRCADQVKNMVDQTLEKYDHLDIAFNNAGVAGVFQRLVKETEEVFYYQIDTNLKGVWLCMKYDIPIMWKQGGGVIINNASITGLRAHEYLNSYSASKYGVIGLTNAAAKEYAPDNIRIVAICSGCIRTPMIWEITSNNQILKATEASIPLRHIGEPEEVAELVLFLASSRASYIAGGSIAICRGTDI